MVDVGDKDKTERIAVARGVVRMKAITLDRITERDVPKGDVFATARIAAIGAIKRTSELIPLCHAIAVTGCEVTFTIDRRQPFVVIDVRVTARDRTGVEMEALTGVCVAALTIYDMVKAIDRAVTIEQVALLEKRGGKGGTWSQSKLKVRPNRPRPR